MNDSTRVRYSPLARQFMNELRVLARSISERPSLRLATTHHSTWSFDWRAERIAMPQSCLARYEAHPEQRQQLGDAYRGLVLHEAAHAALTRCDVWRPEQLAQWAGVHNALEDLRIETWLLRRWPGCRPWLAYTNDRIAEQLVAQAEPNPSHRHQFLVGIFLRWWVGSEGHACTAAVRALIDAAWPACQRFIACLPPLLPHCTALATLDVLDCFGEAPGCWRTANIIKKPLSASARLNTECFLRSWSIFRREIVPIWQRLEDIDRCHGDQRHFECQHFADIVPDPLDPRHLGDRPPASPPQEPAVQSIPAAGPLLEGAAAAARHEDRSAMRGLSRPLGRPDASSDMLATMEAALGASGAYDKAWRRWHRAIDAVSEELLRCFAEQRERWRSGLASGRRLDLRRAMASEADPRCALHLWQCRRLPERCRLAFGLLLDRSGSMDGVSILHAFSAIVLLIEVAQRLDLPLVVHSFNDAPRREYHSGQPLDHETRRRLGALLERCQGNTNLDRAVEVALADVQHMPADRAVLIVLSDGCVTSEQRHSINRRLLQARTAGIATIGLGLGPCCDSLRQIAFTRTITGISADALVPRFAGLVRDAVHQTAISGNGAYAPSRC